MQSAGPGHAQDADGHSVSGSDMGMVKGDEVATWCALMTRRKPCFRSVPEILEAIGNTLRMGLFTDIAPIT